MELRDAMRTSAAIREFTAEPVSDELLHQILDDARFAPSGGNRQGWRVVVIRDPVLRNELRDLYLDAWQDYLAQVAAGLVAWAPVTDREREAAALAGVASGHTHPEPARMRFAEEFHRVPVMLAVLADLRAMAAMDRDLDRYTFTGGASVHPFVWNILLAARGYGLGGVLTTILVRQEEQVRRLLHVPGEYALAAVLALGHPVRRPRRLRRSPVEDFTTVDSFTGPPYTAG